jgi:hypothetical protein
MGALDKMRIRIKQSDFDTLKEAIDGLAGTVPELLKADRIEVGKKYVAEHQAGLDSYRELHKNDGTGTKTEEKKE